MSLFLSKVDFGSVCENVELCGIMLGLMQECCGKYGKILTEKWKKTTIELIIS